MYVLSSFVFRRPLPLSSVNFPIGDGTASNEQKVINRAYNVSPEVKVKLEQLAVESRLVTQEGPLPAKLSPGENLILNYDKAP
ncbi:hypothetical protein M5X11_15580 [Paenibacillus alginolyticus]|uniref:hypothetical protein n=1 Tax=Paenibacillus alginolyticus TaxID=59839 RepID=UPI00042A30E6|nr:hypothetical protein [Paenibacillus alginolyticus]MCY9666364.1 hypothetical protein [Paenibacillus alginolyticus]